MELFINLFGKLLVFVYHCFVFASLDERNREARDPILIELSLTGIYRD